MSGFNPNKRALFRRLVNRPADLLRPPWALDEYAFVDKCTGCGDCAKACEESIISQDKNGLPWIDFKKGECTFCSACVDSCQQGALVKSEQAWDVTTVISAQCLAKNKTLCRSCGEVCDQQAIQFPLAKHGISAPAISADCNGCGACVSVCPTDAINVQYVS